MAECGRQIQKLEWIGKFVNNLIIIITWIPRPQKAA
jgi:hypothetical protein